MATTGEEGQQLQLSDLPDEVLIRILSFLPTTKSAVRKSLGVKGWQHLWKYLTRLAFEYCDSMDFVEKVMDLRDHSVPLESLSLDFSSITTDEDDRLLTWLTKVFPCNVEELTISMDYNFDDFYFSMENRPYRGIFRCQSLVKLDLDSITLDNQLISLPCLKYLKLCEVRLKGDESTEELLSSPLLESLIIVDCSWYIESICMCSPKLQVLKIWDNEDVDNVKICVIGDNLKYFYYMGNLLKEYQICASSSMQLTKVEVYVNDDMIGDFGLNCYKILKGLSDTRNLALSDYFLEGLQYFSELLDTIPVFDHLTRLDIRVSKDAICIDSLVLMKIYERCPHLECLNIGKLSQIVRGPQLSPLPLCFRTRLKKIIVHYYVLGDDEADVAIDVLLNSALVLEELIIYYKQDKDGGFQELQDRLNQRPRVSKNCIILVKMAGGNMPGLSQETYYDDCYLKSMNES